jgi:glutathione S-transferase
MKLFYSEGSPYARIVRIALLELGLDEKAEKEIVTLRDPESALLPYNPVGRVPTLQLDDGTVLTESPLILFYLDTQHGGPPLLPRDGSDGWIALSRMGTAMGLIDGIAVWNRALRLPEHERSPTVLALERTRATRTLDALENAVAAGAYCGRLDAARIALGSTLGWAERRHRTFQWREGHPVLSAWYDDIAKTPSFTRTLPPIV